MIGTINVPVKITASGTKIEWKKDHNPEVNMRIALDGKSMSFTPSQNKTYKFTIIEDGKSRIVEVIVGGTEPTPPTPPVPPIPTPPLSGTVIFDSKVHTNLHDGKVRTTTKEGIVETRASGDPKIVVNADGTFSLVSGSGGVDNFSVKVRSRHNEGGDGPNRFGGLGTHIDRSSIGMKIEKFHNEHESGTEKSHGVNIADGQFHILEFTVKDGSGKIDQIAKVDGVQKLSNPKSSPPSYYVNKALYDAKSYFWLRLNNSDHGRIYVYKNNYNSTLRVIFKFEPSKNAITFKHVIMTAI